jgi:hypothetical protein
MPYPGGCILYPQGTYIWHIFHSHMLCVCVWRHLCGWWLRVPPASPTQPVHPVAQMTLSLTAKPEPVAPPTPTPLDSDGMLDT